MTPAATPNLPTAADTARHLVDQSARAAHGTVNGTRRVANRAIDSVDDVRASASESMERAIDRTEQFGHHTMDALRDSSQQLRLKAQRATDASADYIRHEPIKSVLIAAAAGAAVMVLTSLFARSRLAGR